MTKAQFPIKSQAPNFNRCFFGFMILDFLPAGRQVLGIEHWGLGFLLHNFAFVNTSCISSFSSSASTSSFIFCASSAETGSVVCGIHLFPSRENAHDAAPCAASTAP